MKTAIFLGAGASKTEGAPMQKELFRDFFSSLEIAPNLSETQHHMGVCLREFFNVVFGTDWRRTGSSKVVYPTFEEALGILDLSATRCESLRGYNIDSFTAETDTRSHSIRLIRHYLILAMGKAIDDGIKRVSPRSRGHRPKERQHKKLVSNLEREGLLSKTIFISANYDLLIDEALGRSAIVRGNREMLDYGVEFTKKNFPHEADKVAADAIKLYKIHGSLGWLYCSTCNNLIWFAYKAVLNCIFNIEEARCAYCRTLMSPMIVPPTYYKDMSKVFLSTIWNKTECALRDVEHVIFCGYSFPDADMHIKYLLKRVQTNREQPESIRFTVINKYYSEDEKIRYERFLGSKVTYTKGSSFEDLAEHPQKFYMAKRRAR